MDCDINYDGFPSFDKFIRNPKLFYCFLRYVWLNSGGGGVDVDGRTIKFDNNNRLSVPIDNDTIYVDVDGLMKAISGGGSNLPIVSDDLIIDEEDTEIAINFKDPALNSSQVATSEDQTLEDFIIALGDYLEEIGRDIESKVNDVDISTNTVDMLSITKNTDLENGKEIAINLDVTKLKPNDLSNLKLGDNLKTLTVKDIGRVGAPIRIDVGGTEPFEIEFFNSGIRLVVRGAGFEYDLIDEHGVYHPIPLNNWINWDVDTGLITFKTNVHVIEMLGNIPVGLGEVELKQLKDVSIISSDGTVTVVKTISGDGSLISFNMTANSSGGGVSEDELIEAETTAMEVFDV